MKNMVNKILIDTNILLDYVLTRKPYFDNANKVVLSCTESNIKGCIASHSIANMFYIMRKDVDSHKRREILINFCVLFDVVGVDKGKLIASLNDESFLDFEDCLQVECAKEYGAEYIVTRNVDDYNMSEIPVTTPKEYLEVLECMQTDSCDSRKELDG
jgi:predicted nucleic acid-binding protein